MVLTPTQQKSTSPPAFHVAAASIINTSKRNACMYACMHVCVCMYVCITTCGCASVRMHCSGCGAVRQHPSSVCPVVCGFVFWALRWLPRGKAQRLPPLRGDIQRVATPDLYLPTPRAPVQKRSLIVRPILFAFLGSRRQWVVNPPASLESPFR